MKAAIDEQNFKLAQTVIQQLTKMNATVSTAESCTGGLIASTLTDISGASTAFPGSVISYANEVKINQLQVSAQHIKELGAVSDLVAKEMAKGVQKLIGTEYAIAVTGIAGPNGGSANKPVGTLYIGLATPSNCYVYHFYAEGDRQTLKKKFTLEALKKLNNHLNKGLL